MDYKKVHKDQINERFVAIVENNYTLREYRTISTRMRAYLTGKIRREDGNHEFYLIWKRSFSLKEEIVLDGFATAIWSERYGR